MQYVKNEKSKTLREKSGKTIRQIAEELGYTTTMISLVCSGKVRPSWELARKLGALCGKEADFFLP